MKKINRKIEDLESKIHFLQSKLAQNKRTRSYETSSKGIKIGQLGEVALAILYFGTIPIGSLTLYLYSDTFLPQEFLILLGFFLLFTVIISYLLFGKLYRYFPVDIFIFGFCVTTYILFFALFINFIPVLLDSRENQFQSSTEVQAVITDMKIQKNKHGNQFLVVEIMYKEKYKTFEFSETNFTKIQLEETQMQ